MHSTSGAIAADVANPWKDRLAWAGVPLCVFGLLSPRVWAHWPGGRFLELIVISMVALAIAWSLRRFARWPLASGLLLVWCIALLKFAGIVPVATAAAFGLAAIAIGGAIAGSAPIALQCACGLAVFAGVVGWLLPLPVHRGWMYWLVCGAAIVWRRHALADSLRNARAQWQNAVGTTPDMASFAVLALGLAATACWLPTLQFDDLAYHLNLPWQLATEGRYALDPSANLWALAPWGADVVQAIAQLMAGAEARGPVNAIWLAIAATGAWSFAAALDGTARARWAAVALFGSLPLTAVLAGNMQTELPMTALLLWVAALITHGAANNARTWRCIAILCGALLTMKVLALGLAAAMLIWAIVRVRPLPSARAAIAGACVLLLLGGSSYVYATNITGNPLFPGFNGWFHSPLLPPTNLDDSRWHAGFGPALPWRLTFDTDRYMEVRIGAAGFALIALAGVWLLAIAERGTRVVAIIATCLLFVPLAAMQYLRYAYPGMTLLLIVLVVTVFRSSPRTATPLITGLCVLNLAFQAAGSWFLGNGALKMTILRAGDDRPVFTHFTPERTLIVALRQQASGNGKVLAFEPTLPYTAELGRRGLTTAWYDPGLHDAAVIANRDDSGAQWVALLRREDVSDVLLRAPTTTTGQRAALRDLHAAQRMVVGEAQWWSVPAQEHQ